MKSNIRAVILVGGKCKRMGKNKSFLNIGNTFLLDTITKKLKNVFNEIYVVADSSSKYEGLTVKCLVDIFPDKGPLGGIYTALELIDADYIFVFACDMVFLSNELIKFMLRKIDKKYDAIVPLYNNHTEPLHSIYARSTKDIIRHYLVENRLGVHSLFSKLSTLYIKEEDIERFGSNIFFNINTIGDYKKALTIVGDDAENRKV